MTFFDTLEYADRTATLVINRFSGPFTDTLMPELSNRLVSTAVIVAMLGFCLWRLGWRRTLIILGMVLIGMLASDQLANLVKYSAQRLRPCWDSWMTDRGLAVLERRGGKYGFFSAHAATSAAMAGAIVLQLRRSAVRGRHTLAILAGMWVVGVSVSRVFVGKHFLGDTIVGIAVGVCVAALTVALVNWAANKFFAKFVV